MPKNNLTSHTFKRCPECIRPICQRQLTLRDCNDRTIELEPKEKSYVEGTEPMREYGMHDFYLG